jgi:hypothetical protein
MFCFKYISSQFKHNFIGNTKVTFRGHYSLIFSTKQEEKAIELWVEKLNKMSNHNEIDICGSFWWRDIMTLVPLCKSFCTVVVRAGDNAVS